MTILLLYKHYKCKNAMWPLAEKASFWWGQEKKIHVCGFLPFYSLHSAFFGGHLRTREEFHGVFLFMILFNEEMIHKLQARNWWGY